MAVMAKSSLFLLLLSLIYLTQARPAHPAHPLVSVKDSSRCPESPDRHNYTCGNTTDETCCLTDAGYGCCPLKDALCCADKKHCCPSSYVCNSDGYCIKPSVPSTRMASPIKTLDVVTCGNGESLCPFNNTCCRLSGGQWGCCPMPGAKCCHDNHHCCPNGYMCSSDGSTCNKGSSVIPSLKKVSTIDLHSVKNTICPPKNHENWQCPTGDTCCPRSGSAPYGCCPHPNAACCADGFHCCENGYTCSSDNMCTQNVVKQTLLIIREVNKVSTIKCPDGKNQCPDGNTCCQTVSGAYGCCPVADAVCCTDRKHCCPYGYTCNTGAGTCSKENTADIPMLTKVPAIKKVKNVICPDGHSECPSGQTCCLTGSVEYGCCPDPDAVCCADKKHCCPSGYTCDTGAGTCSRENTADIPMLTKGPAINKVKSVICPDGTSECPTGQTCCLTESGKYGCCPDPKAVCCADKVHCCPEGYTCNTATGKCYKVDTADIIPMLTKRPAIKKVESVTCPDGQSECPDGNTCCKIASGVYGCCPVVNAVCCADEKHCCPSGYTCNAETGKCNQENTVGIIPMLTKRPVVNKVKSVECPDGSECSDGETCCPDGSGGYGCCPNPNAVCCDGTTCCKEGQTCCPDGCCPEVNGVCCGGGKCCPAGYTCSGGRCILKGITDILITKKPTKLTAMLTKRPAINKVGNTICPDGTSECPSGNTCCLRADGNYGCCNLTNAVCCSDGQHCCPNDYYCSDVGTCVDRRQLSSVPKTPFGKVKDFPCDDGECSGDGTCCSGDAKPCCPIVNGLCCGDGTCCHSGNNTCCPTTDGKGCCPVANGVCCDNDKCCPEGYNCGSDDKCYKGEKVTPMLSKVPSHQGMLTGTSSRPLSSVPKSKVKDYPCNGDTCSIGTCCSITDGVGCCPIANAVCCDNNGCCPEGYNCGSNRKCYKGEKVTPMQLSSVRKTLIGKVKDFPCDGGYCPDGDTCCPSNDDRGCCPEPNGVCCDNDKCCPGGYICGSDDKCYKEGKVVPMLTKRPTISKVKSNICPDGTSDCGSRNTLPKFRIGIAKNYPCGDVTCSGNGTCCVGNARPCCPVVNAVCCGNSICCPNGNTCCPSTDNKGCCPLPNAVCCSNDHCCPEGSACGTDGKCYKEGKATPMLSKVPSHQGILMKTSKVKTVICPDGKYGCPDGNTCCLRLDGSYGCCPLPSAVCCADRVHCCPNGYSCNPSGGTCTREGFDKRLTFLNKVPKNNRLL